MIKKIKNSLTTRIYSTILVSAILIFAVGILTYQLTNNLLDRIKSKYAPDVKIEIARSAVSELYILDNTVQSYLITQDTFYLRTYNNTAEIITNKLLLLKDESKSDSLWDCYSDSMWVLFQKKMDVFDKLIELKGSDRVSTVIDKIDYKLRHDEVENEEKDEKKGGWLGISFRKKDKPIDNKKSEREKITVEEFKDLAAEVKKEEIRRSRVMSFRELGLYKESTDIVKSFNSLLNQLEANHIEKMEANAVVASKSAQKIVFIISVFCILSFTFLVILIYAIRRYTIQNANYRNALRNAKDEAEKLAKTKEVFLSNMSHEIRTPLNSIIGFTDQLLEQETTPTQRKQLEVVKNSSEHLLVIVNDVLDFAKIESGKLQFVNNDFMISELVSDVKTLLEPKAKAQGLNFTYSIDKGLPEMLNGDPIRLKQVLINLVGNAIKFTPTGSVKVFVKVLSINDQKVEVKFEVHDSGIGIAKNNFNRIFEEFIQADHSIERKYGGSGLGLPIVKKIVEHQGGSIEVESEIGKGSVFSVIIPFNITDSKKPKTKEKKSQKFTFPQTLSVLAADDEEYNRLLLQTIFAKNNIGFTIVTNGKEMLEAFKNKHFDLILTDVRMPEMSGLDATKLIRKLKDKKKSKVPIIALTAAAAAEDFNKCKEAGMDDYISKPFKEFTLLSKINSLISEPVAIDISEEKESKHNDTQEPNLTDLNKLSGGNVQFVINMLTLFMNNANQTLAEIDIAAEENNIEKVGFLAHRLAAPSKHIGMKSLYATLKETEAKAKTPLSKEEASELLVRLKNVATECLSKIEKAIDGLKMK